jgi:hypothetical protein
MEKMQKRFEIDGCPPGFIPTYRIVLQSDEIWRYRIRYYSSESLSFSSLGSHLGAARCSASTDTRFARLQWGQ